MAAPTSSASAPRPCAYIHLKNFYLIFISFYSQSPTMVAVVYHLVGHATVDADVLSRDETRLVGT